MPPDEPKDFLLSAVRNTLHKGWANRPKHPLTRKRGGTAPKLLFGLCLLFNTDAGGECGSGSGLRGTPGANKTGSNRAGEGCVSARTDGLVASSSCRLPPVTAADPVRTAAQIDPVLCREERAVLLLPERQPFQTGPRQHLGNAVRQSTVPFEAVQITADQSRGVR